MIHDEESAVLIEQVAAEMPDTDTIERLADFFKLLGDPTRVKILTALAAGELCAGDIAEALKMERTAISHQLRILRTARLVKARRDGKMICYSFDDGHVGGIILQALEHINE